jgi:hypothetical protein
LPHAQAVLLRKARREAAAFGGKWNDADFYVVVPVARYFLAFPEQLPVTPGLFADPKLREFEWKPRILGGFGPRDLPREVNNPNIPCSFPC